MLVQTCPVVNSQECSYLDSSPSAPAQAGRLLTGARFEADCSTRSSSMALPGWENQTDDISKANERRLWWHPSVVGDRLPGRIHMGVI